MTHFSNLTLYFDKKSSLLIPWLQNAYGLQNVCGPQKHVDYKMFVQKCSMCVKVFFVYILAYLNKSKKKGKKMISKESAVYTI